MLLEYLRRKRIRRIRKFYSQLQSWGLFFPGGTPVDFAHRRTVMVSRDALLHFGFTVLFLMLLGSAVSAVLGVVPPLANSVSVRLVALLISGVLAVEAADAALDRLTRAFDIAFDYVLPVVVLLIAGGAYIGVRFLGMGPVWSGQFTAWRDAKSREIQSRPVSAAIEPAEGNNWFFVRDAKGQLQPLDRVDAQVACDAKGAGWQLFAGDSAFVPDPAPTLGRGVSVWMAEGIPVGQIGPETGLGHPHVYRSAGPDELVVTLCVKPEGR